jgi:hypothetical protein
MMEQEPAMTHPGRLEHLRKALEAACEDPSPANMALVGDAFQAVQFSTDEDDDDDVMKRRNDALELYAIQPLARKLMEQLGSSAPAWLREHVLGEG